MPELWPLETRKLKMTAILKTCFSRYSSWMESHINTGPSLVYWIWCVIGLK